MDISITPSPIDVITDFLSADPTPQEILEFQLPSVLLQRVANLLELNRENNLSSQERAELDEFLRMEHFMTMLKLKTQLYLLQ